MSAQTLIFNNVELLGYTHQNNFFGEKSFNYSATKTISLQGFILDLQNSNGVDKIFNDVNQIKLLAKDFHNIIINNENYGTGKIVSLDFDSGNWVRTTRFNATIEILEEVPLQNLSSPEFDSLNLEDKKFNLIRSFSETFSLDFDTQNKILGGEHNIEIEYDADNKNINLISLAQILARELLKTVPTNIAEGNYNTRSNYRSFNSENYNLIDGKCGFSKKFSYKTEDTSNPYSVNITHSIGLNQDGIATVTEKGDIKAEYDQPSLYQNALQGLNNQLAGVFSRSDSFFQAYKTKFNILRNLNQHFINKSIQINKFAGTISYTIDFDNDVKKENPNYLFEYTSTLDRDDRGVWSASEAGNIIGVGKAGSLQKFNNADTVWQNTIKNAIFNRVRNFYSAEAKNRIPGNVLVTLKEISKQVSKQIYNGVVNYTYNYTDDPTIKDGSDMGIRRINIEQSNQPITNLTKDFIITNSQDGYALQQSRKDLSGAFLKKQGSFNINVSLEIGCTNQVFNGLSYFNKAKSLADQYSVNNVQDIYLESINFSSNEIEQTVTYSANYKYS